MTAPNGIDESPPPNPLGDAIQRHAQALVKYNTTPNGMMQINPMQLFVDLQLAAVRIEVLFEALVETGAVDPAKLSARLCEKLMAEVEQMNAPVIQLASGSLPRGG